MRHDEHRKISIQRLPARSLQEASDLEKRHPGGTGSQSQRGTISELRDGRERRSNIPQAR
jgi:hypothetical protein